MSKSFWCRSLFSFFFRWGNGTFVVSDNEIYCSIWWLVNPILLCNSFLKIFIIEFSLAIELNYVKYRPKQLERRQLSVGDTFLTLKTAIPKKGKIDIQWYARKNDTGLYRIFLKTLNGKNYYSQRKVTKKLIKTRSKSSFFQQTRFFNKLRSQHTKYGWALR